MLRKIVRTKANSLLLGRMPKGCRLCIIGAKMVLFMTGICSRSCFYCPLSDRRRGKDVVYANERPVRSVREAIEEARLMDALGTGITGGDPTLRFERTLRYIRALRRAFGKKHHVHMYCASELPESKLRALRSAGLDEIRFHVWSEKPVKDALKIGLSAGIEIPALPGEIRRMKVFLERLDSVGCEFANINELEFSDTNVYEFRRRGFRVKSDESMAVRGSEEAAKRILKWAASRLSMSVHYCPSSLKDSVQLRNRLVRRARKIMRPHEVMTGEGLLFKGIVLGLSARELWRVRGYLVGRYEIPPELVVVDMEKKRVELHWKVAEEIAPMEPHLKFALVEEYPTHDRLETTLIPISDRKQGTP
ncbi:MAG: radical SAM protein [Candidatus Hadarchaeales archaeon]